MLDGSLASDLAPIHDHKYIDTHAEMTCNGNCNESICDTLDHNHGNHDDDESATATMHDCLSPIPSRKQASSSQEDKSTVKKRKIRK